MVVQDGRDYATRVALALDTLIAAKRVPPMVAVMIQSGGGDAQGSQRGLEYDTVSGRYAEFVESEVLPLVARNYKIRFTKDPEGRAAMGASSGAAAAFSMAWFHPEWYRRVLSYSGTFVNQQSPPDPATPEGAWDYHAHLIREAAKKPIRIWMHVGEKDLHFDDPEATFHNWPLANQRMAAALKAKGYAVHYVFAKDSVHVDQRVVGADIARRNRMALAGVSEMTGFWGEIRVTTSALGYSSYTFPGEEFRVEHAPHVQGSSGRRSDSKLFAGQAMKGIGLTLSLAAALLSGTALAQTAPAPADAPWRNPALPTEQRVNALIGQMTIEEKASQLVNQARAIPRLGVPAYNWWSEALHGVANNGYATVFPEPVGLAATFDAPAIKAMGEAIGTEGRVKWNLIEKAGGEHRIMQGLTFWSPNINIFRDPRWGRGQETYGEDPYLSGELGVAFVRGMQGDDAHYYRVSSTAKHYAVHSGPEPGRHSDNFAVSLHDQEDTYLPAFRTLVVDGKVESVMCAYNAINGQAGLRQRIPAQGPAARCLGFQGPCRVGLRFDRRYRARASLYQDRGRGRGDQPEARRRQ